jgi:hypothetical protein
MLGFTTQNLTPASGGYIAIVAPGAPINTTVDIFNLGSEWSASNTVTLSSVTGQFDVYVAGANAHVIIDVLGFFAPPPQLSVGTAMIANAAVTAQKLSTMGCTTGQILRRSGSTWACATPNSCPQGTFPAAGLCAEPLSPAAGLGSAIVQCTSRDGYLPSASQIRNVWSEGAARDSLFTNSDVVIWAGDYTDDQAVKTITVTTSTLNPNGTTSAIAGSLQYFCVRPPGVY